MKASEFNKLSKEEKLKVPFKDKPTINKIGVGCAIPSIVFFPANVFRSYHHET